MKNLLMFGLFAVFCTFSTGCQEPLDTGVNVDNLNGPPFDDALIRVWVLDEEQIQNPPATRQAADAIPFLVTYPSNLYQFQRAPGTYFVVASNETHYQSLAPLDAFEAGTDFSLLQVEVIDGFLEVGVENTDTPTLLPEITLR